MMLRGVGSACCWTPHCVWGRETFAFGVAPANGTIVRHNGGLKQLHAMFKSLTAQIIDGLGLEILSVGGSTCLIPAVVYP